jgi:hypothetical protein
MNGQHSTINKQQSILQHQERVDQTTMHHLQAPIINIDHWRSSTNLITKDHKNHMIDIYRNNNDNQPDNQRQAKSAITPPPMECRLTASEV